MKRCVKFFEREEKVGRQRTCSSARDVNQPSASVEKIQASFRARWSIFFMESVRPILCTRIVIP